MSLLQVVSAAEWQAARDISLVLISPAPQGSINFDDYSEDFDVLDYFGLNVLLRDY